MAELGIKEEDFPVMDENALKDATSLTTPREAKLEDIIQIFKNAL